jgi:hypothetical protein
MSFFRKVSLGGAISDFASQWKGNPYRWRVLGISVAATVALFLVFIPETEYAPPVRFEVDYVSTFADGERSDAEILQSNCANQALQDERDALMEERLQVRREAAAAIGRATGLDVDEMEAEADAERAEAERIRQAAADEVRERTGAIGLQEACDIADS